MDNIELMKQSYTQRLNIHKEDEATPIMVADYRNKSDEQMQSQVTAESLNLYTSDAFAQKFANAKAMLNSKDKKVQQEYDQAVSQSNRTKMRRKHHKNKMCNYADNVRKNAERIRAIKNINKDVDKLSEEQKINLLVLQLDNINNEYKFDMHYIRIFGKHDDLEKSNEWVSYHTSLLKRKALCSLFLSKNPSLGKNKKIKKIIAELKTEYVEHQKKKHEFKQELSENYEKTEVEERLIRKNAARKSEIGFENEEALNELNANIKNNVAIFLKKHTDAQGQKYESVMSYEIDVAKQKGVDLVKNLQDTFNNLKNLKSDNGKRVFKIDTSNRYSFFYANCLEKSSRKTNAWKLHAACANLDEFLKVAPEISQDLYKVGIDFKIANPRHIYNNDEVDGHNEYGKHFTIYPDDKFAERFNKLSEKTKAFFLSAVEDEKGNKLARKASTDKFLTKDGKNIRLTARFGAFNSTYIVTKDYNIVYDDRRKTAEQSERELEPVSVNSLDDFFNLQTRIQEATLGASEDEQRKNVHNLTKLKNYAQAMVLNMIKDENAEYALDFYRTDNIEQAETIARSFSGGIIGVQKIKVPYSEDYLVCVPNAKLLSSANHLNYYREATEKFKDKRI